MIGSKTYDSYCANEPILKILTALESACLVPKYLWISSISYNVCSAGQYCEEVAVRIQLLMFQGPGAPSSMLGICYRARATRKNMAKRLLLLITIAQMDQF